MVWNGGPTLTLLGLLRGRIWPTCQGQTGPPFLGMNGPFIYIGSSKICGWLYQPAVLLRVGIGLSGHMYIVYTSHIHAHTTDVYVDLQYAQHQYWDMAPLMGPARLAREYVNI